jgi:hypothetical protein
MMRTRELFCRRRSREGGRGGREGGKEGRKKVCKYLYESIETSEKEDIE